MNKLLRRSVMLTAFALVAAACDSAANESLDAAAEAPESTVTETQPDGQTDATPQGELPTGTSALEDMRAPDFPEPLVDIDDILSGGPPPDGIPAIDDPQFVTVLEADEYLTDGEPVVVLEIDGDARAYPIQVLMWHEIVNDTVGGTPVAVTYCPLCNSAVTYVRDVGGLETTFGTSGRLFASALVMYDRATESLWTHFDGKAVVGVLTGEELEAVAAPLVAWSDFREAHPNGMVLDRDATGFSRDYGRNPYFGYDDPKTDPFLFRGTPDDRARTKQRVVGIELNDEARAWTLESISGSAGNATAVDVGGQSLVIFWEAGQATALEDDSIDGGRDVGSVGVFVAEADGQSLSFTAADGGFTDAETGSTWNILGQAVAGPLAGTSMERVPHLDTFWFAWSTYRPGTDITEA